MAPRVAALAAEQYGVAARRQLLGLGLSSQQIERLVRAGFLHPVHRGVYAAGHGRLTRQGKWMAAVLAGGPGAVLSHQSAGISWGVLRPSPLLPHITTAARGRARPGIQVHYSELPADETTTRNGIPTTTVARTLLDLAAVLDRHRLERAVAEAEDPRHAELPSLAELVERHRGRRGLATLRAVLHSGVATLGRTRSPLEDRLVRFVAERGFERPELSAPLALGDTWIEVDRLWRGRRVAVELERARRPPAASAVGSRSGPREAVGRRRLEAGAGDVGATRPRSRGARRRPAGAQARAADGPIVWTSITQAPVLDTRSSIRHQSV